MKVLPHMIVMFAIVSLSLKATDPSAQSSWHKLVDKKLSKLSEENEDSVNGLREELHSWDPESSFLLDTIVKVRQDSLTLLATGSLIVPFSLEMILTYYGYTSPIPEVSTRELISMVYNWSGFLYGYGIFMTGENSRKYGESALLHLLAGYAILGKGFNNPMAGGFGFLNLGCNTIQIYELLRSNKINQKSWFDAVLKILKLKYMLTSNTDGANLLKDVK